MSDVAPEFRSQLAAVQGRRTAVFFALSLPITVLAWTATWRLSPQPVSFPDTRPAGVGVLARLTDWSALAGGVAAVLTIALLIWTGRRGRSVRPVLALQASAGFVAVVTSVGCALAMIAVHPAQVAGLAEVSPLVAPLGLATAVVTGCQLRSVWRSVQAVRRLGEPTPA